MPAPAKTSLDALLVAALEIVEAEGLDSLTISRLAREVGVKGPSLYKYFRDRKDLLRAVEERLFAEVTERFIAADHADPRTALRQMCFAYRAFALERPRCYSILFALNELDTPQANEVRRKAIHPTLKHFQTLYGEEAFLRNRAMVGFLHGYVSLEILHGFRLGMDTLLSFSIGVDLILAPHTPETVDRALQMAGEFSAPTQSA